jgi:hypothetical protein
MNELSNPPRWATSVITISIPENLLALCREEAVRREVSLSYAMSCLLGERLGIDTSNFPKPRNRLIRTKAVWTAAQIRHLEKKKPVPPNITAWTEDPFLPDMYYSVFQSAHHWPDGTPVTDDEKATIAALRDSCSYKV